ncbi:hypothetical protein J8P50_004268 [Salmonella enterica]|nr:hypothetical protein [Salmonella enterica]
MRRLPVFFVLDCSESMIGENLKKMTDGLQMIVGDLRGYTDLMVDGAPSPHQSDTTLRWLIDRLRS